jgi:hypothetical protein
VLHELRLVERTHQQRALEHRHRLGRSLVAGRLAERLRHCWQQRRHKIDCELEPRHHSLAVDPHERNHANRPVTQLPQDHRGTILLAEQLTFTASRCSSNLAALPNRAASFQRQPTITSH